MGQRDSTIIYRSFHEAIKELPKENQADLWNAVFEFSFEHKEPELSGVSKAVFTLIRPQIEANYRKYVSGKKGGRPNQTKTKPKPKRNQAITKAEPNVNVNVNVNDNDNVKELKPEANASIAVGEQRPEKKRDEIEEGAKTSESKEVTAMLVALRRAARVDEFKESRDLQRQWARNFLFLLSGTKERPPIPPEEISRRLAVICSDSFKSKNRSSIAFLYREVKGFVEPAGSMVIDCS